MKKYLLLSALLLSGAAGSYAQDVGEPSRNAVCIALSSGDAQYVAFSTHPLISTSGANLVVANAETGQQTLVLALADVASITATSHDFTTAIDQMAQETGREIKAIYDLQGQEVTTIKPGRVYIIKYTDGSTKKTTK